MWLADHPVATSAIIAGLLVLASIAYAAYRGLVLWRSGKAAKKEVESTAAALQAEADKIEQGAGRLTQRQGEIDAAVKALLPRVAAAKVLAAHAAGAAKVAKSPLKLIGR